MNFSINFSISTKKLIVMSLLTAGFYGLYWVYRNWRAIKIQESKKLSPFWRACFSVFYCYTLFKRILVSAAEKGFKSGSTPGTLTAVYVLFNVIYTRAPSPFDLIGILSFIPIITVNNAVRFNNLASNSEYEEQQKLTKGEILFLVFGILVWLGTIANIMFSEV